jgi:hypothetical protein
MQIKTIVEFVKLLSTAPAKCCVIVALSNSCGPPCASRFLRVLARSRRAKRFASVERMRERGEHAGNMQHLLQRVGFFDADSSPLPSKVRAPPFLKGDLHSRLLSRLLRHDNDCYAIGLKTYGKPVTSLPFPQPPAADPTPKRRSLTPPPRPAYKSLPKTSLPKLAPTAFGRTASLPRQYSPNVTGSAYRRCSKTP